MKIRLPPYAKRHIDRLRMDLAATVWIAIGPNSWRYAQDRAGTRHIVIVCPPGDDPVAYDWTICAGHDPVLLVRAGPTDGDQVRAIIEALIRDGTDRVLDDAGALYVAREVAHAA